MNGAQLHLALNHFPVILSILSLAILLWGWLRKNSEIKKIGLCLVIVTAGFAATAYFTGDPAEDVLRNFPNFTKELVHEHEEAGEAAFIVSIIAGLVATLTMYIRRKGHRLSEVAFAIVIILTLMSSMAFFRTAHLGGLIHHEEIRPELPAH